MKEKNTHNLYFIDSNFFFPHNHSVIRLYSHPPVFNEPLGEEGLLEGMCLPVALTLTLNIC